MYATCTLEIITYKFRKKKKSENDILLGIHFFSSIHYIYGQVSVSIIRNACTSYSEFFY